MKKFFVLFFTVTIISTNFAQSSDDWKISGQIQLRTEVDGRDFSNKTYPLTFTSIRTRFAVAKSISDKINFFAQIQDSRVFGQEGSPTTAIDNVDLHQAYLILNNPLELDLNVQVGRFHIDYGTERFLGVSNWSYIPRSFDGMRLNISPKNFNLDLFALTLNEPVAYISSPNPGLYPYPSKDSPSFSMYGFYKPISFTERSKLDLLGYYEVDRKDVKPDTLALQRLTITSSYFGNYGDLSTIIELAYQLGKLSGKNISAYLISALANYKFGHTTFTLGADILSGNDPKNNKEIKGYNGGYGTVHKFYGFMDYFPSNAGGLGLNNFYLKANFNPQDSKFSFAVDLHHFMTNQKSLSDKSALGQEIDLTVVYKFVKGTNIMWGGSLFFPGDIMKALYAPREDIAFWSYIMITANF